MKLTLEQKLIECSKLMGHVYHNPTEEEMKSGSYYQYAPEYHRSYDDIIPVIQKQSETRYRLFISHLVSRLSPGQFQWDATPAQLLDSLLETHGFEV